MNVVRNRSSSIGWIPILLLSILIILNEVPILPRSMFGNGSFVPFAVLFLFFSLSSKIVIPKKKILFAITFVALVIVEFSYKAFGISTSGFGIYVNNFSHYFFFFAMLLIVERINGKQQMFLIAVIIVSVLFSVIQNTLLYERIGFNFFMRQALDESVLSNATSTQFSVAAMMMAGTSLIAFLNLNKHRILWMLLFLILTYFNIFIAQRAINLILTVVLYTLIIIVNNKRKAYMNILLSAGAIMIILMIMNYGVVIEFISNLLNSERLSQKLYQIKRALDAGDILQGTGSLTARYMLYLTSVRTWLSSFSSFLFGIGEHFESNLRIGNHSQFIDTLGEYGIVGAALLFYTVFQTLKILIEKLPINKGTSIYRQVISLCAIFLIRGVLGVVLYGAIAIQLFIFLPLVVLKIKEDV